MIAGNIERRRRYAYTSDIADISDIAYISDLPT